MPFPADWEDWGQNYTGLWYHLAITYDGNYLEKYVNGYLVYAMAAPTSPLPTATSDLYIAAMSMTSEVDIFQGILMMLLSGPELICLIRRLPSWQTARQLLLPLRTMPRAAAAAKELHDGR